MKIYRLLKKALIAPGLNYLKPPSLNNNLYLLTILKSNRVFRKYLFFFVDAGNFLSLKYASFTELGWFKYQLREGE
jgi:hypothetical protein